jgi:formate hydrogenlyase subunit 6/NADH:ubiquinone oxidoreductase subunit I
MSGDGAAFLLSREGLDGLLTALRGGGYRVLGPVVRDGAIVYDDIERTDDLPAGKGDEQAGGTYRLVDRGDDLLFGYAVGPHSWKRILHPPRTRLFRAEQRGAGFEVREEAHDDERCAFLGVRPCDLEAIAVQDRVFLGGDHVDPTYRARRDRVFLVAVNCTHPSGACFCASMQTGPRARGGYDLALTEIPRDGRYALLLEVGTRRGAEVVAGLERLPATEADRRAADAAAASAAEKMGRRLDTRGVREMLARNGESPRWAETAARCLACANCTMVCPTCFCTTVEDAGDLGGQVAERWRRWDSCFTTEFSYIHGGSIRTSGRARYRQWLTHKLSSWHDQFGTSGCVGCGRCITWCPVGIDLTEEVEAIRSTESAAMAAGGRES